VQNFSANDVRSLSRSRARIRLSIIGGAKLILTDSLQRWIIVVAQNSNHLITLPTMQMFLRSTALETTKWHHVAEVVYSARDANPVVRVA